MKRSLLLTVSSLALLSSSHAQITKGTVLVGGTVAASTYKTEASNSKQKERGFTLSPSAGMAISDNHILGVSLTYGHGSSKTSDVKLNSNQYGGGLFYRRYVPLGKNFYFFANGDARYNFAQSKSSPSAPFSSRREDKTGSLTIYPGIAYALNKRFHLEVAMNDLLSVGYTNSRYQRSDAANPPEDNRYKSLYLQTRTNLSTNLAVGIRMLLDQRPAKDQTNTTE